jgi:hypothetical protein
LNFLIKAIHASLLTRLTKAKRLYPKVLPPNKFLLSSLSEKFPPSYIPLKIEVQMTQPKGYLFKKDKYRKADGLLQNGGR